MRRWFPRASGLAVAALALSLVAAGCGGSDDDDTAATTTTAGGATTTTTAASSGGSDVDFSALPSATLNGSGATFPKVFYEEAIAGFKEEADQVTLTYGGGGSGKGRQDLADQVVDWAGTDGLVKDEDKPNYKGGEFLYVPTVAAPITVSYNLDVEGMNLSPATIAGIFQRQIMTWNDPAIAAENPDADLPDTAITVAVRSDGSGTTENFTKFLVAGAPDAWTLKSGSTVEWPADVQKGAGNGGVSTLVKGTPGAIGYVDLADADATGLSMANIKNKAGEFVEPTLEGASAALDGAKANPDLSYNPLWADGKDSYPITAPTWIIVYKNQTDKAKGEALKGFLTYVLTDGQDFANEVLYARLPDALQEKALAQIDSIVVPA